MLRSLRIVAETLWNLRRNTSPWQRATVAQDRLTIRSRNPEISTSAWARSATIFFKMGFHCDVGDRVLYEQQEHCDLWEHEVDGPTWGTLISSEGRGANKRFMCKFDDGRVRVLLSDDAYRHRNDENPLQDDVGSENSDADNIQAQMDADEESNCPSQESGSEEEAQKSGSEDENEEEQSATADMTRKVGEKAKRTCSKCGQPGHDVRTCKEGEPRAESSAQGAVRNPRRAKASSTPITGLAGVQIFFRRCPRRGCAALLVWSRSLIKDGP